jgi:hypothetical protein
MQCPLKNYSFNCDVNNCKAFDTCNRKFGLPGDGEDFKREKTIAQQNGLKLTIGSWNFSFVKKEQEKPKPKVYRPVSNVIRCSSGVRFSEL